MLSAPPLGLGPDPTGSGLLAHQGGWDEILLVVGPLALVAGLLWLANRRVSAQLEEAEAAVDLDGGAGTDKTGGPAGDTAPGDRPEAPGEVEGSPETDPRL